MRAVAEAMVQRRQDQILFDFGDCLADAHDGALDSGFSGVDRTLGGGVERVGLNWPAIGRAQIINRDFLATRQDHRAVHRILKFADIAEPGSGLDTLARGVGKAAM